MSAFAKYIDCSIKGCLCLLVVCGTWVTRAAEETLQVVFETGFEQEEGYQLDADLVGQMGWLAFDGGDSFLESTVTGSSGLVDGFLEGGGQQAYLGYLPPDPELNTEFLSLLRPFDYPLGDFVSIQRLRFSVVMSIVDSSNEQRDNFRWSAYNTEGFRLFTLDFDNETKDIAFALDDGEPLQTTGYEFENSVFYDLTMEMDFQSNQWTASIGGVVVVDALPMTTQGNRLDLANMDAIWAIYDPRNPGDNFLVFDDYRLESFDRALPIPSISIVGLLSDGQCVLRLQGEPNTRWSVSHSNDLSVWQEASSDVSLGNDGTASWIDSTAPGQSHRFYRVAASHR